MHGCSTSVLIVNAEVGSMGGVVEGGVGIANKTSPRKAAIEKVQAELRQEYGVRDERKRELEFLEKGGNPLDFKVGNGASVSVQSTSIADQHHDQFVTSEAKDSFAFTASPHGDSVESSDRPEATPYEPNSADNIVQFDAEHEFSESGRNLLHPSGSNVVPSQQSFQMDGSHKTQEHGDSVSFGLPRKAYKRRNRSRPNRDGARSSSTEVNPTRACHSSFLPSRHGPRDVKGSVSDVENQNVSLNLNPNPTNLADGTLHKTALTDGQDDMELAGLKAVESTKDPTEGVSVDAASDAIACKIPLNEPLNQQSLPGAAETPSQMDSNGPQATHAMEETTSAVIECQTSVTAMKVENQSSSCQMNGFSRKIGAEITNDAHDSSVSRGIKVLDFESSCTQTSMSIDGNNDSKMHPRVKNADSNGNLKNENLQPGTPVLGSDILVKEKKDTEGIDSSTLVNKEGASAGQSQQDNVVSCEPEEELNQSESAFRNKEKNQVITEGMEGCEPTRLESERKPIDPLIEKPGLQNEKSSDRIGGTVQEEVETSACDAAADFESQDHAYYEDEGETSTFNMAVAFEGSKSSTYGQKKRRHLTHAYGARLYELGSDSLPMHCAENKILTQHSALLAKRPGSSLNVSIPTKRVRTASRRVISPFGAGASGSIQLPNRTGASSGDTNSFQDDQSTLRGGMVVPNSLEVESTGDFEKQLPFDSAEVSTKPKKKKKAKHLNAAYEQRWQVDSSFQNEQFQKDHSKKRSESYQFEYNGNSGLLGQPMTKKPKIMRQPQDNSLDNIPPSGGTVPSPVASQMSNMSNPNKFIKMLGGRDRGRKAKALKMPSGQPGAGTPWSLFEDQALVVLVHDLGPNWELVSDAINSTLHFKCTFRKAKECKERHNFLMDRTSGDGADSAEDSGSSQPYPSTLPGIPKGSARQLFQRLQGPMEEDILKSHFEKIIVIGQKQHSRKTQDPKPLQQPHSSHNQVCPNNLNGGPILTPLDLCDASIPGPDMLSLGYQGPLSSGLAIPNQGSGAPMLPASGASSALQGSPNMMIGNNFSSSPGPLNSSASRDGRYVVPRSGSLPADEQQRMQQYIQMMPGRNIPQPNISSPGALPGSDRGVRVLHGGNGMGMIGGVNRSLPMARPGFQGVPSSSMVNSGSMVSPAMSSANMHAGVGAGQGSSMLRPRESLHMMRPGLSQDSQRQMMVPDLQMPGNSQGMSHFGGLSSPFPNQTTSSPVSSYPLHHQSSHPISPQQPQVLSPRHPHFQGPANHASNTQQQVYAIRLAKERQLQHRLLQQQPQQQQQQQFAASNSLMPHVQSQPQLPISSSMPNSSQVPSQTSSPPVSLSSLTPAPSMNSIPQHQQKHPTPTQGVVRNAQAGASGLTNQMGRQRQRQPHQFAQANRQHPQQRQQLQAQQAKVAKGVGRGNVMVHQNIPTDTSLSNGVSTSPGNQCLEKGEPASHLLQGQGLYTGSALNSVQPTRQYVASQSANQSLPQQKMYSGQTASSSKHGQMTSQSNNSSQGHVPPVSPPVVSSGHHSALPMASAGSNHQQTPSHQKLVNQNQSALQRVQPNRQIGPDPSAKPQGQVVSPPSAHQWHATEPLLDQNALKPPTNLSSLVSMPSNSSESVPQSGQGLGQRPSASLTPSRHDITSQWQQQQQSQVQQPHSPVLQPQQHQQPLLPLHSQQQAQLLQAGSGNLFGRSSDTRLE
ncbi:Nucleoplasmin ATPase [Handroanthus impetiginosus]|uniref:Nucleoplasmin ATPase n=1 Tax=Handroanthus impetiginosus TaxID=429701 RepID=A0A2G9G5A1_9LAMI|nr:Nucleoplasmin ATPase [Handroanthus impetiginosus]